MMARQTLMQVSAIVVNGAPRAPPTHDGERG
jgi:hypothetical protein